jgi:NAD dependent epimerase/dehydratase
MLAGRKALVTGAGGFIGSHVTEALVKAGAEVTAMIRYSSTSSWGNLEFCDPEVKRSLHVIAGNIEDSDFVLHAAKDQHVIFHLAALIAIPYSYVAPRSYVRTNVEGTLNVLEAARRLGVGRVIHTSTSEVYGTAVRVPIDEEHPLQGQSPYSASKIGADKIAEGFFRSFQTPVVTVRPFNTYGPRQSARAFIPTIIAQALERDVIELGALEPQRDMTFVADTVAGFLAAATAPGVDGETINLGTGTTRSIGDFAARIMQLMAVSKPIRQDPRRVRPANSEVLKLVCDATKAQRLLGWEAKTPLDDGLRAAISFVDRHRDLYKPHFYAL